MLPKSFGNSLHVLPDVWHASLILQLFKLFGHLLKVGRHKRPTPRIPRTMGLWLLPGAVFVCGDQYGRRNFLCLSPWLQDLICLLGWGPRKPITPTTLPQPGASTDISMVTVVQTAHSQKLWDWDFFFLLDYITIQTKTKGVCVCVSFKKFLMSSKSHLWPRPSWRVVLRGLAVWDFALFLEAPYAS